MQLFNPSPKNTIHFIKASAVIISSAVIAFLWWNIVWEIITILFGASIISFILAPLCKLIEIKLPRPLASALAVISVAMLILTVLVFLFPLFVRQIFSLADLLPGAFVRIGSLIEGIFSSLQRHIPEIQVSPPDLSVFNNSLNEAAMHAASAISSVAGSIYRIFLMMVLSCFLLADRQRILLRMELLVPLSWRKAMVRTGNTLLRELRLYLRGQVTIALAVGILATIAMFIIGLRSAPLLGLTVGVFNVIPYFGPLLGGIPAVISALSISWQKAAITVFALFLVQQADGMLISPRVMGNITGFSPAVVLIALFAGAHAGGIGGMLVALPALMAIRTLYRVFVQRHENN